MPWTLDEVDQHQAGLTVHQKRAWVRVANSALRACLARDGTQRACEASAIRQANAIAVRVSPEVHTAIPQTTLQTIVTHTGFAVRYETLDDMVYLVAPAVPLIEGVLNEHYVPRDEIAAFIEAWNGLPIPLDHPTNEYGDHVSANTPDRLEQAVGRFFNAHMDGPRLLGEVWINLAKCERLGGNAAECVRRMEAGESLEISTAFWSESTGEQGTFRGTAYKGVHYHLRPDHIALLPQDTGACSNAMGCGVRAHRTVGDADMHAHVRQAARRPSFEGTEAVPWGEVVKTFAAYRDGYYRHSGTARPATVPMRVEDASVAMRTWIAHRTLLGEATADNDRDLVFFPVVNPETNRLNEGALRAILGGRAAQADIADATRESARVMARRLLNSEFNAQLEVEHMDSQGRFKTAIKTILAYASGGTSEEDAPGCQHPELQTHLTYDDLRMTLCGELARRRGMMWGPDLILDIEDGYVIYKEGERVFRLAYTVDDAGAVTLSEEREEVQRNTRYVPVVAMATSTSVGSAPQVLQEETMKPKIELVATLIAHQQTTWTSPDAAMLETFGDDQLVRLIAEADARPTPLAAVSTPTSMPVLPATDAQHASMPVTLEAMQALLKSELDARDTALEGKLLALGRQASEHGERAQLAAHLATQGFTEQDCAGMSLETLRKVARTVAPATFAGLGFPAFPAQDDDELPGDAVNWS